MSSGLTILKVSFVDGRFVTEISEGAAADRNNTFTVAMVFSSLGEVDTLEAFRCDFMAVAADVDLRVVDPRASPYLADAVGDPPAGGEAPLRGRGLHDRGVAAFLIESDLETTRERILRQADTMLALKQARAAADTVERNPK